MAGTNKFRQNNLFRASTVFLVLCFGLQACGGGPDQKADATSQAVVDQSGKSNTGSNGLGNSGGGSPQRLAGTSNESVPVTATSSSSKKEYDDNKDTRSMYWFLGTVAAIAAVIGITYLITGGKNGFDGSPVEKSPEKKETDKKPSAQALKVSDQENEAAIIKAGENKMISDESSDSDIKPTEQPAIKASEEQSANQAPKVTSTVLCSTTTVEPSDNIEQIRQVVKDAK